jgi:hypothetical protein
MEYSRLRDYRRVIHLHPQLFHNPLPFDGVCRTQADGLLKRNNFHPVKTVIDFVDVMRIVDNFSGPARIPVASNL